MTLEEVMARLNDGEKSKEDKIKILRKSRGQLLEEIHKEQQLLDQLDYMLYSMKTKEEQKNETYGSRACVL